eukprot:2775390-Lingulodinium_polyedra.AAC.1
MRRAPPRRGPWAQGTRLPTLATAFRGKLRRAESPDVPCSPVCTGGACRALPELQVGRMAEAPRAPARQARTRR